MFIAAKLFNLHSKSIFFDPKSLVFDLLIIHQDFFIIHNFFSPKIMHR